VQPTNDFHDRGTGTWAGPAPTGYKAAPTYCTDGDRNQVTAVTKEPSHALLGSGQKMPMVGMGTYQVASPDPVREALALGYRHFDCASFYDNEAVVGEGLRGFLASHDRGELFITSKVWNDAHGPEALRASVEKSVADLGCGHLDLCLVHWPVTFAAGDRQGARGAAPIDMEGVWRAMESLVDDGLARAIGVSNFSLAQVEEVLALAKSPRHRPVVNQVELHPRLALRKLVGVCRRKGVQCVAYSPLGQGSLVRGDAAVERVAAEAGKTPAQVLLKWNTQRGVPVIPKASTRERLAENIEGHADWRLTYAQKGVLDALDAGAAGRVVCPPWHAATFAAFEEGGVVRPAQAFGYDK